MNLLLYYYKCLDDYKDENKIAAYKKAQKLEKHIESIRQKYPEHCDHIQQQLNELSEYEKHNELNPDLPANSFGLLMAQIFTFGEGPEVEAMKAFGYHLGRFIYLMDAVMDFRYDVRHQLYNPLTASNGEYRREMLEMVMADTMAEYEKLPIENYLSIIENVLYSGIWTQYSIRFKESDNERSL